MILILKSARVSIAVVLTLIPFALAGQGVNLDDGLLMHLNFNENLNDQSETVENGSLAGADYGMDRFGNCAFAICFNQYLQLVNMDAVAVNGLQDFSISIWFRKEGSAFGTLISAANNERNNEINLNIDEDGLFRSNIRNLANRRGIVIIGNTSVDDGQWHHVVLTREGASGDTYLYVDKQEDGFKKMPLGVIEVNTGGFVLGNDQDCLSGCYDPRQQFLGNLDDFRVYNRVLNQAEIDALFEFVDGEVDTKIRGDSEDLFVCEDAVSIEIKRNFDSFRWSTGSTDSRIEVSESGRYIVTGMIKDCEYKDTVNVTLNESVELRISSDETELACTGNIVINASPGFDEYVWQDGSEGLSYNVTQPGIYRVRGVSVCGEVISNEIEITLNTLLPLEISTNTAGFICSERLMLSASEGFANYRWSNGQVGNAIEVDQNGTYEVTALNICGDLQSESIDVSLFETEPYFIPNTFTPNGDGKNESFEIDSRLQDYSLKIIDRWGKRIFSSKSYQNDWTAEGIGADTYYYTLSGPCLEIPIKGWIRILR